MLSFSRLSDRLRGSGRIPLLSTVKWLSNLLILVISWNVTFRSTAKYYLIDKHSFPERA
jgi:hypothetical protein